MTAREQSALLGSGWRLWARLLILLLGLLCALLRHPPAAQAAPKIEAGSGCGLPPGISDQAWTDQSHGVDRPAEPRRALIFVDLRRNRLTLVLDGLAYKSWRISPGDKQTPTPQGAFRVTGKSRNWGGGFGTRWIGLNVPWGQYGIHGTDQPALIGRPVSHGCVRMRNRDVEELYNIVSVGTSVLIYGYPRPERTLVEGHTGVDVAAVQARLKELGYYHGSVDGRFGPGTRLALLRFQKERGLRPTGSVGGDEYKALGIASP